jgi:hypothetical protein
MTMFVRKWLGLFGAILLLAACYVAVSLLTEWVR